MIRPIIKEIPTAQAPEMLVAHLLDRKANVAAHSLNTQRTDGVVLLRTSLFDSPHARYSFVTARPFLTLRTFGSRCELSNRESVQIQYGNPWKVLDGLMSRYELLEDVDLPFPLGGCFGYWGYDLKNFVEPKLARRAINDLELPDCHIGFYDSLVAFDHLLGKTWIVSTGLGEEGARCEIRCREAIDFWEEHLSASPAVGPSSSSWTERPIVNPMSSTAVQTTLTRSEFVERVQRAKTYIRAGDIYQVNLAQRLGVQLPSNTEGWDLFQRLSAVSPSPYSAYLDCGDFQLVSSSPELFLRLSGSHIQTRPIKGTRARSADHLRDAQLTYELQSSPKELAELVMITDLLRNDLGKVCEFGTVQVPELVRLERFPQVQHLVSTVEGRLRRDVTHFTAFASSFPGGSITGAPKIRAMEIIDELEPVTRGPYTGALGYLGFNRESQLSITIRSAVCREGSAWFYAGAGIVADSDPDAEYQETLDKARGFMQALPNLWNTQPSPPARHFLDR